MAAGLAELFLEGRAPPHPSVGELEAALSWFATAGREAWPDLHYDERAFARDLALKVPAGDEIAALSALRAQDLFIACACARGDERAIALFEERYLAALPRALPVQAARPDSGRIALEYSLDRCVESGMDPALAKAISEVLGPFLGVLACGAIPVTLIYISKHFKLRTRELELEAELHGRESQARLQALETRLSAMEGALGSLVQTISRGARSDAASRRAANDPGSIATVADAGEVIPGSGLRLERS